MELSEPATAVAIMLGVDRTGIVEGKNLRSETVYLKWHPNYKEKKTKKNLTGKLLRTDGKAVTNKEPAGSVIEKFWSSNKWQEMLVNETKLKMAGGDRSSSVKGLSSEVIYAAIALAEKNLKKKPTDNNLKKKYNAALTAKKKALSDVGAGISASASIYNWLETFHSRKNQGKGTAITTVYLTGTNWDADIEKFRLEHAGMRDFNSSDLVIRKGDKANAFYFGCSLKKKVPFAKVDPTMINRSIDEAIKQVNGNHHDAVKRKQKDGTYKEPKTKTLQAASDWVKAIDEQRFKFFGEIAHSEAFRDLVLQHEEVIVPPLEKIPGKMVDGTKYKNLMAYKMNEKVGEAHTDAFYSTLKKKLLGVDASTLTQKRKRKVLKQKLEDNWDYDATKDHFKGKAAIHGSTATNTKPLIDIKGAKTGTGPVREYVNSQIAGSKHKFFQYMKNVLTLDKTGGGGQYGKGWPHAGEIAEELTDHVLKLSLGSKIFSGVAGEVGKGGLYAKKFAKEYFGFGLTTGEATIQPYNGKDELRQHTGTLKIAEGHSYELASILTGLAHCFGKGSQLKDYYIVVLNMSGATINMVMKKQLPGETGKELNILNMSLRYKGTGFAAAMQFQAFMHDDLKHIIQHGCAKGQPHGKA